MVETLTVSAINIRKHFPSIANTRIVLVIMRVFCFRV